MHDSVKAGIFAGLLGTAADVLIHWSAFFAIGATTTAHYIYQLIFPFQDPTTFRLAIGVFTHFAAGSVVGVLLALIFKYFGKDYAFYKGIGLGIFFWVVHVAVIPNIVGARPFLFRTEVEAVVDLVAHISYGIVATLYLKGVQLKTVP